MTEASNTPGAQPSDSAIAATFQRLLTHLRHRTDVQNVDIMGTAGFCRNCLADWLMEADGSLTKDQAREYVYGMPYSEWKAHYQAPASDEQLAALEARQARKAEANGSEENS